MRNEDELVDGGYAVLDGETVRVAALDFDGAGGVLVKPVHRGDLSTWGSKVVPAADLTPTGYTETVAEDAVGVTIADPFEADNADTDGVDTVDVDVVSGEEEE